MNLLSAVKNAEHYVKITVLKAQWDEEKQIYKDVNIEGIVTGGSININGTSAIRRSGSLTMLVPEGTTYYKVTDIDNLISANKKIKVEIGIKDLDSNSETIWSNMGIFAVGAAGVTHNLQGVNISITLKDLMCLLNGELGGLFMSTVIHSPLYDVVTGAQEYPKIKDLIYALVCDYGGFPRDKVLIPEREKDGVKVSDIPDRIRNTVRWTGSYEIYSYDVNPEDPYSGKIFTPIIPDVEGYEAYSFNDNIGYINTDFTYPTDNKELTSNAGESIVSILDKIKGVLGNFEYFFDVNGIFHFQEMQNYINEGSAEDSWTGAFNDAYLTSPEGATEYQLDPAIGISYSNNPQYSGIKNDIMAWGQFNDSKLELGYHLIIDETPTVKEWQQDYNVYYRTDETGILRAYPNGDGEATLLTTDELKAMDWRQQIYLDYVLRKNEANYKRTPYSLEIANSWPLIYDVQNLRFYADVQNGDASEQKKKLNSMPYFIDVLDPFQEWGDENTPDNPVARKALQKLTIKKAGRRPWSKKDNDVNCLFSPDFPNCVYVQAGQGEQTKIDRNEALAQVIEDWEKSDDDKTKIRLEFMQLAPELYKDISISAVYNSAFDWIRSIIHEMTTYNESINVTCMPFYGVEPNTRIYIKDDESNIDGDYVIKSMSIPLTHNGTMTIQASKAIERI